MWNKIRTAYRKFKAAFDFKAKKKKAKWEEFVKVNAVRINYLPVKNGRRTVPVVWNPKTEEWQWVDRKTRRRAQLQLRRMQ